MMRQDFIYSFALEQESHSYTLEGVFRTREGGGGTAVIDISYEGHFNDEVPQVTQHLGAFSFTFPLLTSYRQFFKQHLPKVACSSRPLCSMEDK